MTAGGQAGLGVEEDLVSVLLSELRTSPFLVVQLGRPPVQALCLCSRTRWTRHGGLVSARISRWPTTSGLAESGKQSL